MALNPIPGAAPLQFKSSLMQTLNSRESKYLFEEKAKELVQRTDLLDLPINPVQLFSALGFDPKTFRRPNHRSKPYVFPQIPKESILKNVEFLKLKDTLDASIEKLRWVLRDSLCLSGFNPTDLDSKDRLTLHLELKIICSSLLEHCKGMQFKLKLSLLEDELIPMILIGSSVLPSSLYRDSEQLSVLAKLSKSELLEIALRQHFYGELLHQERDAIEQHFTQSKKLPQDLDQLETQLQQFVTKNGTYSFDADPSLGLLAKPILDDFEVFAPIMDHFEEFARTIKFNFPLSTAIPEIETGISQTFVSLDLNPSTRCAANIQLFLREILTRRIISSLAEQWRNAFNQTGLLDENQFVHEAETLHLFATSNGTVPIQFNTQLELLVETFGLVRSETAPFSTVRAKLSKPKSSRSMLATISSYTSPLLTTWSSFPKLDTATLNQNKLKTIAWSEQRLYDQQKLKIVTAKPEKSVDIAELLAALPQEVPAAPRTYSIGDKDIPTVSYVSAFFEGTSYEELPPLNQRDVLYHVTKGIKGRLEILAKAQFNGRLQTTLEAMKDLQLPATGLDASFVETGQKLLDYYYSSEYQPQHFHNLLEQLPKVPLFYQYVYEMAKAANIKIEDWDAEFGRNNWDKIPHLTVQALERCLHTVKQ